MRCALFAVAFLLPGLFSCQVQPTKEPLGLALARGRYGPAPEQATEIIRVPATNDPRVLRRGEILIHHKASAEASPRWVDPKADPEGAKAWQCASMVGAVLDREFQLGFRPGWEVLLVDVRARQRLEVSGRTRLREGLFAGIPLPVEGLGSQELSYLTTALAHEYAETLLGSPDVLGCALCAMDWNNRWVGEGIAEWMTSLCEEEMRRAGLPIRDRLGDSVVALMGQTSGTVNLAFWEMNWGPQREVPETGAEAQRTIKRYLASEYVVHLWYIEAKARGMEYPVAEFARFVASFEPGPSQEEVVQWLENSSGLELEALLKAVPMDRVLAFHQEKNRQDS